MLISICIPTFNRLKYLKKITSFLITEVSKYNLENIVEICISDNSSTDGSASYLKNLSADYSFIKYYSFNVNMGPDCNFVNAYSMGSGKYLWLLGDDEHLEKDGLVNLIHYLDYHSPDIIWLNHSQFIYKENEVSYMNDKVQYAKCVDKILLFDVGSVGGKLKFVDSIQTGSKSNLLFMSSHIIRISHFKRCFDMNAQMYVGSYAVHLLLYLLALKQSSKAMVLVEPILSAQYANNRNMSFVWTKLRTGILSLYTNQNIDKSWLKVLRNDFLRKYLFQIIGRKIRGEWRFNHDYPDIIPFFSYSLRFWIFYIPLSFLPSFVFRFIAVNVYRLNLFGRSELKSKIKSSIDS